MNPNRWALFGIAVLLVAATLLLGWQHRVAGQLREEIAHQRAEGRERNRLLAEQQRLMAKQVSVEELDRLRAERAAIAGLRNELDTMKQRATKTVPGARGSSVPSGNPISRAAVPTLSEAPLAPSQWRNVGDATPEAAFESALWAAAGGDVETVAGLLHFDDEARTKAAAMFARLPEPLQKELGSPEHLIALLAAKDVPQGSAQITGVHPYEKETRVMTQLVDAGGEERRPTFTLRNEAGHWRFVVPARAVDRYAAMLQTPSAVTGDGR